MSKDIYNIQDYSDDELYDILNLTNPTDRELEAKILMMIHKYENSSAKSSKKLLQFFENIYSHFFDDEDESDEEMIEDFTQNKLNDVQKEENTKLNATLDKLKSDGKIPFDVDINQLTDASFNELIEEKNKLEEQIKNDPTSYDPTKKNISQQENILKETTSDKQKEEVYTKELTYAGGALNPILKQTKKRVISIDSQYRADKRTFPTEFTFDLSEPLKDVVSLKLYSVQIPFTWYTISKTYGSNFFYIKGNAPGIKDNPNHDVQIDISAGNYTPTELAVNLNGSILRQKSIYTDMNFNNTDVSYNRFTSLTTVTLDMTKIYNENSYYVNFPVTEINDLSLSPYLKDSLRNTTIPSYLGLQTTKYYPNVIKTLPSSDLSAGEPFFVTNNDIGDVSRNNFFTVYKYVSDVDFTLNDLNNTSIIDLSFDISMSLVADVSYTRQEIVADISNQILNNYYLSNSYFKRTSVESYNNSTDSFYEMKINPNRKLTNNVENSKIAVVFPENTSNTNMWYGSGSCFGFENRLIEVNDIIGEKPAIAQNDTFIQKATERNDQLQVHFTASAPQFQVDPSVNDLSFSVLYTDTGLSTSEFLKAVNTSVNTIVDNSINFQYDLSNEDIDFTSSEINQDPSGTYAYIDNTNRFNFKFDIVKDISMANYFIDLSGSIIADNIGEDKMGTLSQNVGTSEDPIYALVPINDFTLNYTFNITNNPRVIDYTKPILTVRTKTDAFEILAGDISDNYIVDSSLNENRDVANYATWQQHINEVLTNFKDPSSNLPLFTTNQGFDSVGNLNFIGSRILAENSSEEQDGDISFNIAVNKKLTPNQYNLQLLDLSASLIEKNADFNADNTWRDALKLSELFTFNSFTDTKYNLFNDLSDLSGESLITLQNQETIPETIGTFDASGVFKAIATEILPITNLITITTGRNDTIEIVAEEDGVASSGNENNLILTIPSGAYSRGSLLIAMNAALQNASNNSTTTKVTGGFELSSINQANYLNMNLTILRKYLPSDFVLVFYDELSFAQCSAGFSSVKNTTWDSTLGWVLGFREFTVYDMGAVGLSGDGDSKKITGDTGVSTQLYNYFLLCIDDFNQNHLNDGLVTITNQDTSVPLPSYANRTDFTCDPATGETVYNASTGLTGKQVYAAMEIYNSKNTSNSLGSSVSSKSYGSGPFVKDVFGVIPLKVSNLVSGSAYTEFGGTLQNQERTYFGPVNIRRMTVQLRTDRGDLVDLNNANWSFSLIAEQLNKNPTS